MPRYSGKPPEMIDGDIFRVIVPLDDEYSFEANITNGIINGVTKSDANKDATSVTNKMLVRIRKNYAIPPNNLPDRNPHFTGRDAILEDIHRQFHNGQAVSLRQSVAGLGGVGKTQAALEYAYRYAEDYDDIWWVNAESGLQEAYRAFAKNKGLPASADNADWPAVLNAVKSWFDQHTRFLFIFDKVEDLGLLSGCLPRNSGHVLITTRNALSPVGKSLDLNVFLPEEATAFLKERLGRNEGEDALKLAERLGYLPLALDQAAAYILANRCNCAQYLELLADHGLKTFDQRGAKVYGYGNTINTTWQITIEKIGLESSKQLFNLCVYFAPDDIPLSLLIEGRSELPEPLQATLADKLDLNEAVLELTKYSLLREKNGFISIHRLVQEVVRNKHKQAGDKQWIAHCLSVACAVCEYELGNRQSIAALPHTAPHVLAIARYAEEALEDDDEAQEKVALLYHEVGRGFSFVEKNIKALD